MMTMTELFYGPVDPTWIAHPRLPASGNCHRSPDADYNDDILSYRCSPYVQRNAMVAPSTEGVVYPYQARSCVHGGTAALAPVSIVYQQVAAVRKPAKQMQQSPERLGVLQSRNVTNVQTVHFMVPLCCGKCEDRVKEKLLGLDDMQRVITDQLKQKVSVTSTVAPEKLLKRVQKIKKRSTFWPQQAQPGAVQASSNNQRPNQAANQFVNDENAPRTLSD